MTDEQLKSYDFDQKIFDNLVDALTAKVVTRITRNSDSSFEKALLDFHNSETFEALCTPSTGMYIEGEAYIYDLYMYELSHGTIRTCHY